MATQKPDLTRVWANGAPPANVVDPDTTTPGKVNSGWLAEVPPFEHFNFLQKWFSQGLANLNEEGIFKHDNITDYSQGNICKGSDNNIYFCVIDNGPGTSVVDPVGDTTGTWAPFNTSRNDIRINGALMDGSTDDVAAILATMVAYRTATSLDGLSILGSTLELQEGYEFIGQGALDKVSGLIEDGTWLQYSDTGNAILINGDFQTFDSRRGIKIKGVSLNVLGGANAALETDYMTNSIIDDFMVFGNNATSYGIKQTNSFNNAIRDGKLKDCTVAAQYIEIGTPPDDVFSGQTLFENFDFWDSEIGSHIVANDNVMAQLDYIKSHWKTNNYGMIIEGGNNHTVDIQGGHFEENTTNDVWVKSDVLNGPKIRAHFNNTVAPVKVLLEGNRTKIDDGTEFVAGNTSVQVSGDGNTIGRCVHRACNNPIVIDATADATTILRQGFENTTGTKIQDNGTNTIYEGEFTIAFENIDVSAAGGVGPSMRAEELLSKAWLRRIRVVVLEGTVGATTVVLGRDNNLALQGNLIVPDASAQFAAFTQAVAAKFYDAGQFATAYIGVAGTSGRISVFFDFVPWEI